MRRILLFFCGLMVATTTLFAQRNCGSMEHLEQLIQNNPQLEQKLERLERYTERYLQEDQKELSGGIITIPVVVHVVYNTNQQNISDAQINSQIQVLNDDFRRMNADANNTPGDFVGVAADSEIEFCVTQVIRKATSRSSFGTNDSVKDDGSGGSDAVTPDQAMNMWVCNIGGGILGYAQFPGGPAATDGIVIDYRYFGTTGTATAPFNLGRTATHEVGHYLNLRHIWGDGGCNVDDFVSDTPPAGGPNYTGSPCSYPGPNSCRPRGRNGGDDLPDMFQNYMDYSDDGCMNLFTTGQKDRMWAAINGARPGLLTASCSGTPPPPPPAEEICDNGIDDDGDGQIDCADGDCAGDAACAPTGSCDAPTGLTHTRRKGGREATLAWNAVSGAANYDVEVFNAGGSLIASGTVTGTAANVSGLTKDAAYTWRVRANCGSGTSDWADGAFNARLAGLDVLEDITAYPNPSQDVVNVSWDLSAPAAAGISEPTTTKTGGPVVILVRDMTGRTVLQQDVDGDQQSAQLNVATLSPGVFMIQVANAEGQSVSTKLIKL